MTDKYKKICRLAPARLAVTHRLLNFARAATAVRRRGPKKKKSMEYKKLYDPGEVAELIEWFRQRLDRLPQSVRIEQGLFVPDLRRTVPLLIEFAEECSENPTYSAQLRRFFEIRERLIEQGIN